MAPTRPTNSRPAGSAQFKIPFNPQDLPASVNFQIGWGTRSLDEAMASRHDGQNVMVLYGVGGNGKTQLAAHFATQHAAEFSAVLWLDAQTEERLQQSLAGYAARLPRRVGEIPTDLDSMANEVLAWLKLSGNTKWLMVLDNVDSGHGQTGAAWPENLPRYLASTHGTVLITTRLSSLQTLGMSQDVRPAWPNTAAKILKAWHQYEDGPASKKLLNMLDGLPLAIAHAGAYIQKHGIDIATYLELYQQQWSTVVNTALVPGYERSLTTTWLTSFQLVEAKSPEAANLLRLWAFMDHMHLLFSFLRKATSTQIAWPQWLRRMVRRKGEFNAALAVLQEFSMISLVEDGGCETSYSLTPVLQRWVRTYMTSGEQRAQYQRLALLLAGSASREAQKTDSWRDKGFAAGNAAKWMLWAREAGLEVDNFSGDMEMVEAATHIAGLLQETGHPKECEELLLKTAREGDIAMVAGLNALRTIGRAYLDQGRLQDAEATLRKALRAPEAVPGRDLRIIATQADLAAVLCAQGKLDDAKAVLAGIPLDRETQPLRHQETRRAFYVRGVVLAKQGRLDAAQTSFLVSLRGEDLKSDPQHPLIIDATTRLGELCQEKNQLAMAEVWYDRAQFVARKMRGLRDVEVFKALYKMAGLRYRQGRYQEADDMLDMVLAGYDGAKMEHTDEVFLDAAEAAGAASQATGDLASAAKYYRHVVAVYEDTLGSDHPKFQAVYRKLEQLGPVPPPSATPEAPPLTMEGLLEAFENLCGNRTAEAPPPTLEDLAEGCNQQ